MKILHDIASTLNRNSIQIKYIVWNVNWIEFQFNNWIKIQLKRNEMQIGGKGIENMIMNMMFMGKKLLKNTYLK
jgi:hypothetical protein